jgi:putative membrane protein
VIDRAEDGHSEGGQRRPAGEDPRVRFAAERTLLAWVRTAVALMGFGFVVARFGLFLRRLTALRDPAALREIPPTHQMGASLWIGIALVVLGVAVALAAAAQHRTVLRRLDRGEPYVPPRWSLGLLVAAVLAALGVVTVVYLILVGR